MRLIKISKFLTKRLSPRIKPQRTLNAMRNLTDDRRILVEIPVKGNIVTLKTICGQERLAGLRFDSDEDRFASTRAKNLQQLITGGKYSSGFAMITTTRFI